MSEVSSQNPDLFVICSREAKGLEPLSQGELTHLNITVKQVSQLRMVHDSLGGAHNNVQRCVQCFRLLRRCAT